MSFKHFILGLSLFILVTGAFSLITYQFSIRDIKEPSESVINEISETERALFDADQTQSDTGKNNVEMEKQPIISPQQDIAVNPSQSPVVPPEAVVEELTPQLSCKTQNQINYTLSTNGNHSYGYYVPSTQNPNVLEWDIEVREIPSKDSYWFFAFNFSMAGTFRPELPQAGGYAGFQTDGKDHLAIFSLWGAESSKGSGDFAAAEIYEDGSVNRILGDYPWQVGKTYKFKLEKKSDSMVLYINGSKVGTHYTPSDYPENFNARISLFVEWFGSTGANFPVCVSFLNFSPTPSSLYPSTSAQENPLKFNIETLGNVLMFSR